MPEPGLVRFRTVGWVVTYRFDLDRALVMVLSNRKSLEGERGSEVLEHRRPYRVWKRAALPL